MKKLFNLIIFSFLIISHLHGAKTTIEGYAPGGEGLQIRLYEYEDLISFKEKLLGICTIDSLGNFSFSVQLFQNEVKMVFFRIMYFQTIYFFIEANKNYQIKLDSFYYRDPLRIHIPIHSKIELSLQIENIPDTDINILIASLQMDYEKYVEQILSAGRDLKYNYSFKHSQPSDVKKIADSLIYKYSSYANPYFKNFLTYTIANLYLVSRIYNKKSLYTEFLYNKPFLYNHPAYMDFFSNMFEDYLVNESKKVRFSDLDKHVNKKVNYLALLDSIGRDTLLKNEIIREMVLILNSKKWYTSPGLYFKQDSVLKLLKLQAKLTRFDIHTRIIQNLIFMLTRYNEGKDLPPFKFMSLNKKPFTNDSLLGKYNYFIFFVTWSKACLQHLKAAEAIQKKWQDSLQVIPVSVDLEPITVHFFAKDKKLNLNFYHFNDDYLALEQLSVKSYPQCMFIDKDGKIIRHAAPCPGDGFELYLNKFFEKKNK
ncbi:MAG: redoxin domain-containing protein [Bacteroidales bacterium]|nr:redoxin domain-containing protein [Bacteroidales bacterium]